VALAQVRAKYIFSMHRRGHAPAKRVCSQAVRAAHAVHVFPGGHGRERRSRVAARCAIARGSIDANLRPAAGRFS
jgi:hypothetical protein